MPPRQPAAQQAAQQATVPAATQPDPEIDLAARVKEEAASSQIAQGVDVVENKLVIVEGS